MYPYEGVEEELRVFLTSALRGDEYSASRLGGFTLEERVRGAHWIGGREITGAGLDKREILCPYPQKPSTENARGLNLVAVRRTTVQVTRLPL
jgi:hypothetical protein